MVVELTKLKFARSVMVAGLVVSVVMMMSVKMGQVEVMLTLACIRGERGGDLFTPQQRHCPAFRVCFAGGEHSAHSEGICVVCGFGFGVGCDSGCCGVSVTEILVDIYT